MIDDGLIQQRLKAIADARAQAVTDEHIRKSNEGKAAAADARALRPLTCQKCGEDKPRHEHFWLKDEGRYSLRCLACRSAPKPEFDPSRNRVGYGPLFPDHVRLVGLAPVKHRAQVIGLVEAIYENR